LAHLSTPAEARGRVIDPSRQLKVTALRAISARAATRHRLNPLVASHCTETGNWNLLD
jgi:hypothetical protein